MLYHAALEQRQIHRQRQIHLCGVCTAASMMAASRVSGLGRSRWRQADPGRPGLQADVHVALVMALVGWWDHAWF
jgi:hypothetical protein